MIKRKKIRQCLDTRDTVRLLETNATCSLRRLLQGIMVLCLALGFTATTYGQISSPIVSFDGHSGILIPRMNTGEIAKIANPVDGLLVYDTSTDHFCFFSSKTGTWRSLSVVEEARMAIDPATVTPGARELLLPPHQPSFQADWNVEGNIGANNYSDDPPLRGTTDPFPVVFITNDQERMRILSDGNITIVRSVEIGEKSDWLSRT